MDINGTRYDAIQEQRFDIGTTAIYVGYARKGALSSAAAWTIKKITLSSGSPTRLQYTAENGAVWDNRTTETYL